MHDSVPSFKVKVPPFILNLTFALTSYYLDKTKEHQLNPNHKTYEKLMNKK